MSEANGGEGAERKRGGWGAAKVSAMKVVFSSSNGVVVSQTADRYLECSGQHDGTAIKKAIPHKGDKRCILLLDPDSNKHPVFENLVCIDQIGAIVWKAGLSSNPDVFLDMEMTSAGVLASTWSGYKILLDPETGRTLKRTFVK
jgi:hypothetical protein